MRIFHNLNVDFLKYRKYFYLLSASLFVIGMISVVFRGLAFGIDFKGGTEVVLQFEKPIDISGLRNQVSGIGLGTVEVKTFGAETGVLVRTDKQSLPSEMLPKLLGSLSEAMKTINPAENPVVVDSGKTTGNIIYRFSSPETAKLMDEKLIAEGFQSSLVSQDAANTELSIRLAMSDLLKQSIKGFYKDNPFKMLKENKIGPKVGDELKTDAIIAIILSLVVILIYLAFRFKIIFASGAVLALFHDVLITVGLYAIFYDLIPGLNLEIDLTVIAAFLTLIGYSINDTVIVFDRVRETIKLHKNESLATLMNMSINKTMNRTVLTGGTTLLSCFILLIFGGEVLRAFAFTLTFGIIIGTYSSIFVASAIVLEYSNKYKKTISF